MPKVRELRISFEEREVTDPRVGQPIRDVESILRLTGFLRVAADEEVWALVLDGDFKLIGMYQLAKGGRHATMLDPASLFRAVLLAEGSGVVLVHNHPSNGVRPSPDDVRATEQIVLAGYALGVPLIDHVIIEAKESYSFSRAGMLAWLQAKQLKALGIKGVPDVRHPEEAEAEARAAIAGLGQKEPMPEAPVVEVPS